jgi:hypothetical protein
MPTAWRSVIFRSGRHHVTPERQLQQIFPSENAAGRIGRGGLPGAEVAMRLSPCPKGPIPATEITGFEASSLRFGRRDDSTRKRLILTRFPYDVVVLEGSDEVLVVAVADGLPANILPMPNPEDRDFPMLVVNEVDDPVTPLSRSVAICVAREFFRTLGVGDLPPGPESWRRCVDDRPSC